MKWLAIILLSVGTAWAQAPYKCNFAGVSSLELPLFPDQPNSAKFSFSYQVIGDLKPDRPVIIHLPGGPGGSSINDFSDSRVKDDILWNFPGDTTWILTDPRTVGCNWGDEKTIPDEALTSWLLAGDILALINKLGLKKYILHGHSYGSQLATVVAARASQGEAVKPQAVVVSGVLGRGEASGRFSIPSQTIVEWELLKAKLTPAVVEMLNADKPLGISARTWGRFISRGLKTGYRMSRGKFAHALLDKFDVYDGTEAGKKALIDLVTGSGDSYGVSHFSERLFDKVDCHEFSPADGSATFSRGSMIYDPSDKTCEGEAFDRPYDSADLQIDAPLYYFSGTNDPAAPYEGAYYHFQNQNLARKNFVRVQGGGHNSIGNLFPDCKAALWETIKAGQDLETVLKSCRIPVTLSH